MSIIFPLQIHKEYKEERFITIPDRNLGKNQLSIEAQIHTHAHTHAHTPTPGLVFRPTHAQALRIAS